MERQAVLLAACELQAGLLRELHARLAVEAAEHPLPRAGDDDPVYHQRDDRIDLIEAPDAQRRCGAQQESPDVGHRDRWQEAHAARVDSRVEGDPSHIVDDGVGDVGELRARQAASRLLRDVPVAQGADERVLLGGLGRILERPGLDIACGAHRVPPASIEAVKISCGMRTLEARHFPICSISASVRYGSRQPQSASRLWSSV